MPTRRAELGWHAVLLAVVAGVLFPVVWAVLTSLRPANAIFSLGVSAVSLDNYSDALTRFPIARLLVNSFVTGAGVALAQLLVAVPAAYALVRLRVPGGRWVFALVGVSLLVPAQALVIPQFLVVVELGWRNTLAGLIVPQLAQVGLAVLLVREHMRALPPNLFAAAALDGARPFEVLRYVALPQLRPAMGAVAILVFVGTWNEYLWPALAAPNRDRTTIQVGLALFGNQEGGNYGPLLAAAALASVPVLVVYLFFARRVTGAFLRAGMR
jgi:ABC-type glycerol-3-phosphate transport system permease component